MNATLQISIDEKGAIHASLRGLEVSPNLELYADPFSRQNTQPHILSEQTQEIENLLLLFKDAVAYYNETGHLPQFLHGEQPHDRQPSRQHPSLPQNGTDGQHDQG